MCAWRTSDCMLPDDDDLLARYARMTKVEWSKNKEIILEFWTKKDDKLYQKRLKDERKFVDKKRDLAIQAGKASSLKRKERHSTDVEVTLQQNVNGKATIPHPHPQPTPTVKKDNTNVLSKKPKGIHFLDYQKEKGTEIPQEWGEWTYENLNSFNVDSINYEWSKFSDYWISRNDQKAKKIDWFATWKTWCRTVHEKNVRKDELNGIYASKKY